MSPALAIAELIPALNDLGLGGALDDDFRMTTVTHVRVGEHSFGIAPGEAVLTATLRSARDDALKDMDAQARSIAMDTATKYGLAVSFDACDAFAATVNDADATRIAVSAMNAIGIENGEVGLPMRASEDFGVFGWGAKAAMLCIGPGEDYAALHNPDYDFPDDLIPVGAAIFERIARDLLGAA